MSKSLRERIRGGIYHVMNRGVRKVAIFQDDRDRRRFSRLLIQCAAEYGVNVLAGTQMITHFHIVVETPHGNISEFMQALDGQFANYSNWRHHNAGHLFGRRFRAVVIEDDLQLFVALWYVFNNPCKSRLVQRPEDWPWSTYAASIGLKPRPEYLSLDWLDALFAASSRRESQQLFRQCMNTPDPIQSFLYADDPATAETISSYVNERLKAMEEPTSYRELMRPPLGLLFPQGMTKCERDLAIVTAHITHGYKLAEIARATKMHPGSVSRLFRNTREMLGVFGPDKTD